MDSIIKKMAERLTENELVMEAKKDHRYKMILLEKYLENACKWTKKYMDRIIYADIPRMNMEEIRSMVYIAFEKSVENFDPTKEKCLSFKNFFYLMIKYQGYSEIKIIAGNWLIKNYDDEVKTYKREDDDNENFVREQINKINDDITASEIIKFLRSKNEEYAEIILLKSNGYKNKDICETLNIDPMSLKAKIQYIRKLIREEFAGYGETF